MVTMSVLLAKKTVTAEEQQIIEQPDEEFLEFLASMSEVDGELTDPLDMLEIADNEMFNDNELKQNSGSDEVLDETRTSPLSGIESKPNTEHKKNLFLKKRQRR